MDTSGKGLILACMLVGALLGGAYAAYKSHKDLGYVDGWRVAGGVIVGGAIGAAVGYCFSSVAIAEGVISSAEVTSTLFGGRTVRDAVTLCQLIQKFYDKTKAPMNLPMIKELIQLLDDFGVDWRNQTQKSDLFPTASHKTWEGIAHIHVGNSRFHVALTQEAAEFICDLLNIHIP